MREPGKRGLVRLTRTQSRLRRFAYADPDHDASIPCWQPGNCLLLVVLASSRAVSSWGRRPGFLLRGVLSCGQSFPAWLALV